MWTRLGRNKRTPSLAINYVVLALLAVFTLYPMLLVFLDSFKSADETLSNPLGLPRVWQFVNFVKVWVEAGFSRAIPNSLLVATVSAVGVTLLGALGGYSLGRLKPRGGDVLTVYFLAGGSLPAQMFLVPLFFLWRKLGLVDNLWGLALIYMGTGAPFAAYLLRAFFISLPRDFEDAAKVDGATQLQIIRHVVLPLARPGFLTVLLLNWMGAWNEFFFANIFLHRQEVQTVALRYVVFSSEYFTDWAMTSAMGVLMMLPVMALFLITQETFIKGMTQGGLKF
ncbi:MAG: carbohydrate ABC transporter permease [Anaerolineae bacterium]|nr:carbohydrate ABC transporter permease [Anaerolineae bacterium]